MQRWSRAVSPAVLIFLVGCVGSLDAPPGTFGTDVGHAEDTGIGLDAGVGDADAGLADPDVGTVDADAGARDVDAGSPEDTGPADSGVVDAGDGGADLGTPDAGSGPDTGTYPTRSPWPMGSVYMQSGHSLTDVVTINDWPGRLRSAIVLDPAGGFYDMVAGTIPGSFISWRWQHPEPTAVESGQWPQDMPMKEGLVITTAVPLIADDTTRQRAQVDWLLRAVEDAWQNGNGGRGAPTLLYTTWTQLQADPAEPHPEDHLSFRQRLDIDNQRWEAMQDYVNARTPAGQVPMFMIPGHRLMMRVWDDIQAGTAPFTHIDQLFSDNIHPNGVGAYGLTLLHYACIYGRDPGAWLPDRLVDQDTLTSAQARYFKGIVAQIVTTYPRTGLTSLSARP